MGPEPTIDPRFDPAFQRGYASREGAVPPPAAVPAPASFPSALTHSPAVTPPPGGAASRGAAAPEPEGQAAASAAAPVLPATVLERSLRAPWRNPFLIAIALVGVLLLGGAVFVLERLSVMITAMNSGTVMFDYQFYELVRSLVPSLVIVGGLAILGVLFACASYWSQRPTASEVD